ncbi:hypothetical protein OBBRIDRAFT_45041 [Obba rivulosa]|uniref:Uncharacterized protein n=1 Tax=Obba rivulosa TaxID=1052685 RepID=A0A8E2DJ72_9APHY|nr:hypothetical protein OBBRIDRAFT_45041 [Obba rivulosa]
MVPEYCWSVRGALCLWFNYYTSIWTNCHPSVYRHKSRLRNSQDDVYAFPIYHIHCSLVREDKCAAYRGKKKKGNYTARRMHIYAHEDGHALHLNSQAEEYRAPKSTYLTSCRKFHPRCDLGNSVSAARDPQDFLYLERGAVSVHLTTLPLPCGNTTN